MKCSGCVCSMAARPDVGTAPSLSLNPSTPPPAPPTTIIAHITTAGRTRRHALPLFRARAALSDHGTPLFVTHLRNLLEPRETHANADAHRDGAVPGFQLENVAVRAQRDLVLFAAEFHRCAA